MYNTPIRFDGDIIITDPCYILREDKEKQLIHEIEFEYVEEPQIKDYFSVASKYGGRPDDEDYTDCMMLDFDDPRVSSRDVTFRRDLYESFQSMLECIGDARNEELDKFLEQYKFVPYSPTYRKEADAFDEALWHYEENNPCNDWAYCLYGEEMENLGLTTFLCDRTIYGDWSCHTFNSNTKEVIGQFCADAGLVAVFLLDEVLKYNPKFDYHLNRKWTTTLIKDFHGTVELHLEDGEDGKELTVIGKGNVNFIGKQTGF